MFVGTETGTLGESLRAKVPVRSATGEVIGAASVGILETELEAALREDLPVLAAWLGGAAAVGVALSVLVARLVRRRTHGLSPEQIEGLLQAREAILHGVREGVVAVDAGRVVLANEQCVRLLGLPGDPTGSRAVDVLDPSVLALLEADEHAVDAPVLVGERLLLAGRSDAVVEGRPVARVLSLRDRTEVSEALRELDGQRSLTATLRAQAHEFANNLHVVQGLIDLGRPEDARAFIDRVGGGGDLVPGDGLARLGDSAVAALLIAKAATARERGSRLRLDPASRVERADDDVLTALGNLVDNALDACGTGADVVVLVVVDDEGSLVRVDDDGPGVPAEARERVFDVGVTTKPGGTAGRGIGLALVRRAALRRGGDATVAVSPAGGARVEVRMPPLPAAARRRPGALRPGVGGPVRGPVGSRRRRARAAGPAVARRRCGRARGERPRAASVTVLVVDDDESVAAVHRGYTDSVPGFRVVGVVHRGVDVLPAVRDLRPDLVLLDVHLPDVLRHGGAAPAARRGPRRRRHRRDRGARGRHRARGHGRRGRALPGQAVRAGRVPRAAAWPTPSTGPGCGAPTPSPTRPRSTGCSRAASAPRPRRRCPRACRPGPWPSSSRPCARTPPPTCPPPRWPSAAASPGSSARRYLEHLEHEGQAAVLPRYGGAGRPENGYRWAAGV